MSFSWNYLTRRFLLQNNRDYLAVTLIGSYAASQFLRHCTYSDDDTEYVTQRIYTDDESDMAYREKTNKTDGAVRRKLALAYASKVRQMRAEKERAAQLDAFNYLHGTNLQL